MGACISYPSRVTEENLTEPGTPPPEEEGDHHSSRDSYNSCKSAGSRTYGANGKVAFKASKKQKEEMGKLDPLTLQNMEAFEKDMADLDPVVESGRG